MASIGEQLKQAREAKGSTISQAASATRIKFQHIESIEHNDFSKMAAAAYARGFIKIYAEYLGLDPAPLIELYAAEHSPVEPRPSISDEPRRTPPPAAEETSAESPGETWMDQALAAGLLMRVVLPVGVIVALVVSIAGLARLLEKDGAPVDAARFPERAPLLIEEPPDPYLAVPQTRERMP